MHDAARHLQADAERHAQMLARVAPADTMTPADRYEELFTAVQGGRVFDDSKTFVDCAPLQPPADILRAYRGFRDAPGFDLAAFVAMHFRAEQVPDSHYISDPQQTLTEHIDGLWDVLTRHPSGHPMQSSLLPLPDAYVVPGGRFREMYYWDSYFTMLGLADSGRHDLLRSMADNFACLIDRYGHVPNGNRSYYLSRSQPPLFALMVGLFEQHGVNDALRYLPRLRREHAFWMDGADQLRPDEVHAHCVRLSDGSVLNRYWDTRDTPREEAWREDVQTAARSGRPAAEMYRDLRAAAASGWDFSSRWCEPDGDLCTTRTTRILPVDLNCFLFLLEVQVARLSEAAGDAAGAAEFRAHARARHAAIDRWMWDAGTGAYFDYDLDRDRRRPQLCAATVTPLFVRMASPVQARGVAATVGARLLEEGGLATTNHDSGEQWDCPNGWAPLQWMAIRGLEHYGAHALASEIRHRWLDTVSSLYRRESKLVEKYAMRHARHGAVGGGGGEYPLQDGFGWTNGVTRRLLHEVPRHPAHGARAGRDARR